MFATNRLAREKMLIMKVFLLSGDNSNHADASRLVKTSIAGSFFFFLQGFCKKKDFQTFIHLT